MQIAALYRIEAQARGAPAQERLAIRRQKSAFKIMAFKTWQDQARSRLSAKSATGEALKNIAKNGDGRILFLSDGRIEMESIAVQRTISPFALQKSTPCRLRSRSQQLGVACTAHRGLQF